MKNVGDLLKSEHQKKQEYLADYLDFLRSEADERKQLLQALRDGSIEFKELHLSAQQAYNDMARLLKMLVDDFYKQRVFVDTPLPISANIAVELNYRERKYLFLKSAQAITIQPNDGSGTIAVPAGEWFNVSFQRGLKLTAPSVPDSQYATVILRATDVSLSEIVTINSSTAVPVNVDVVNTNPNGQAAMANSSPVVIASDQSPVPVSGTVALTGGGNNIGNVFIGVSENEAFFTGAKDFHLISAASNNATVIKASAGSPFGWTIYNTNAAVRYVKLYNKATTPAPAADSALLVRTIAVPPNGQSIYFNIAGSQSYFNGLGLATTTGSADNDNTSVGSGDLIIGLDWA